MPGGKDFMVGFGVTKVPLVCMRFSGDLLAIVDGSRYLFSLFNPRNSQPISTEFSTGYLRMPPCPSGGKDRQSFPSS